MIPSQRAAILVVVRKWYYSLRLMCYHYCTFTDLIIWYFHFFFFLHSFYCGKLLDIFHGLLNSLFRKDDCLRKACMRKMIVFFFHLVKGRCKYTIKLFSFSLDVFICTSVFFPLYSMFPFCLVSFKKTSSRNSVCFY